MIFSWALLNKNTEKKKKNIATLILSAPQHYMLYLNQTYLTLNLINVNLSLTLKHISEPSPLSDLWINENQPEHSFYAKCPHSSDSKIKVVTHTHILTLWNRKQQAVSILSQNSYEQAQKLKYSPPSLFFPPHRLWTSILIDFTVLNLFFIQSLWHIEGVMAVCLLSCEQLS